MEKECCCKQKVQPRTTEEKKAIIVRMNKIIGQMNGVSRMIEEDRYCNEVLTQLSAITSSIKSLASVILNEHLHSCVVDEIKEGNVEVLDEVVALFKKFQ